MTSPNTEEQMDKPPVQRALGHLLKGLYFLFGGWFFGLVLTLLALFIAETGIGAPIAQRIVDYIPRLMFLQWRSPGVDYKDTSVEQHPFPVRLFWFMFVGWWLIPLWFEIAYFLTLSVIGRHLGFWMFDRVSTVATLRKYAGQKVLINSTNALLLTFGLGLLSVSSLTYAALSSGGHSAEPPAPMLTAVARVDPTASPTFTPTPMPTYTSTPTPTATPTATSTPTPTSTPAPETQARVQAKALNVRAGPGTTYPVVTRVKEGDVLDVWGQLDDCAWLRVEADGTWGWVAGAYVSMDAPCQELPLAPTPTPTPTPTATPTPVPVAKLPVTVKGPLGYRFQVTRVELLDVIEGKTKRLHPRHTFVVFIGRLINGSDENTCFHFRDWALVDLDRNITYKPDQEASEEAKARYGLDYPGSILGLCVDYDSSEPTYVVFDVPPTGRYEMRLRGAYSYSEYVGRPVDLAAQSPAVKPTPPVRVGVIGQPVVGNGIAITVNRVYTTRSINEFFTADPGKVFLVIDVTIKNVHREKAFYNALNFTVRDSQGFEYDSSIASPDPSLSSGTLYRGEKVRGFVAFEVPEHAKGLVVIYEPWFTLDDYKPFRIRVGDLP